jgi:hypothetical protein
MIDTLRSRLRGLWFRRFYLWSLIAKPDVPVHSLSWLPDGFRIQPIAGTDICVTDRFCLLDEVAQVRGEDSAAIDPLEHRAAMLAGMPKRNLQKCVLNSGESTAAANLSAVFRAESYTVGICVFLESGHYKLSLTAGGKKVTVEARAGRAVSWFTPDNSNDVNVSLDGPGEQHMPVLLMSFSHAAANNLSSALVPKQSKTGRALSGAEVLPEGVWAPGKDHLEAVFGKPDQLTDLLDS